MEFRINLYFTESNFNEKLFFMPAGTQTTLTSLNANLPSYFGTDQFEIEITVISSSIQIDTNNRQNLPPAHVKFEFIVDLPADVDIDFTTGELTRMIDYNYASTKFELSFDLPLKTVQLNNRHSHKVAIDFYLEGSRGIHFLSFVDNSANPPIKKKAVSADPTKWPIIGSDVTECLSNDLGPEIINAIATKTANVFNDWDIYIESNHYHTQGQNGTKVFLNLIIDIPAGGVFNGLTSCTWDVARHCVDFVFDRSLNGGASTSSLASFSIQAQANGADPEEVHYYSFRFADEPKRKKVISADPVNRPK